MKRATSVYVIMLVAFGIGLWAIITTGSIFLRAPHDLSGTWELTPSVAGAEWHEMTIDQSGRFFRAVVDGQTHSLNLQSQQQPDPGLYEIHLNGQTLKLLFRSMRGSTDYEVTGAGALQGQWRAVRAKTAAHRPNPTTTATTQHARP
jgi:hypothetical protein